MAGGGAALSRVSSRGRLAAPYPTVPYSTVPYHTVSYLTAGTYGKAYLTLSLSKKARGKESRCGKPAKMWKTLWKTCCKALRPLRAGAAGSLMGLSAGRGPAGAQRWTGAAREGMDAVGQTPVLAAAGRGGAWDSADRGDVRVRCWLAAGCGLACAFGRAQSGAYFRPVRVWWILLAGALWRPCGAGRGCSAGRAGWLSFREKKYLTSYAKAY